MHAEKSGNEDSVYVHVANSEKTFVDINTMTLPPPGDSPKSLISSYTALIGRMKPLPQWVGNGAVLGLQGGTEAVRKTLQQVEEEWSGNHSDVAAVWLQDWTGQRQLGGKNDLRRVGLWWNWEVSSLSLLTSLIISLLCSQKNSLDKNFVKTMDSRCRWTVLTIQTGQT